MKYLYIVVCTFTFIAIESIAADSLEDISKTILKKHPEILSLESELISRKSDSVHKSTYPDPKIGIAYRSYPYSKDGRFENSSTRNTSMAGIEYSFSQEIPFPGKISSERTLGNLTAIEFEHYTKMQKNRFLKDFYILLLKLHITENKIKWNSSILNTLVSIEKVAKANYSAGKIPYIDVVKNKINITITKDKEIELNQTKNSIVASLKYYTDPIGEKTDRITQINFLNFLKEKKNKIELENLQSVKKFLKKNPVLLFSEASIQKSKAEEKVTQFSHLPETEVFFAYMKRKDQKFAVDQGPLEYRIMDQTEYRGDLMSFGLTMRVPVWSLLTRSALNEREEEKVKMSVSETKKREIELETNFTNFISQYQGADKQLKLHDEILIPQLQQAQIAQNTSLGKISDISGSLQLKMDLYNSHLTREDLLEKKYTSLISIFELTDYLLPENSPTHNHNGEHQ
ncbi:MAG: TolC family protein [Leptospiraceae bacterium]|nr:TolC family protein [Leptospiraceae bacterium]MCK6380289.1 TolC family protein [Leptospiraceae bacterium]NUM41106.1 TolC family protein [Leptospiraceae bacterium]